MNVPPQDSDAPGEPVAGPSSPAAEQSASDAAAEKAAADRQRLAEHIVAGILPGTTTDERSNGSGGSGFSDGWYSENRPPHHG